MDQTVKLGSVFKNGVLTNNPTFVQFLGMCPTLAVTSQVNSALGMGVGVVFVLVLSNLSISLIRNYVPSEIRIPVYIVVIAALVTILEMFMNAWTPDLAAELGTFLKLIVVNCIILGRAEAFAQKNGPIASMVDGLAMGLGFTGGLTLLAIFREVFGSGSFMGNEISLIADNNFQLSLLTGPAGAFLVFGLLVAQLTKYRQFKADKEATQEALA
jgi:Na+-translocating ferredoxin:NAD+ oxidoreductase subunit E